MSKRQILFVDFDRTLFDLNPFWEALWLTIGEHYDHVDGLHEFNIIRDWYIDMHGLRTYQFEQHVNEAVGAHPGEIIELAKKKLAHRNFLYPDFDEVFKWQKDGHDVHILTFGETNIQELKFYLSPQLKDIPRTIILEPKGKFIAEHYPGCSGWLIDDKFNDAMPNGFTEVHLDREQSLPIMHENDIISIKSLRSFEEAIQ